MPPPGLPAARSPADVTRARVLVVDDSFVVRELVSRWIGAEPGLEVVGVAANGLEALRVLGTARPDIVLLDLEMPNSDGLSVLPVLLDRRPDLAIVVVSTLTQHNAELSLRCLALGAVDYVPKPTSRGGAGGSFDFRAELLAKLAALGARHRSDRPSLPLRLLRPDAAMTLPSVLTTPRLVMIGASTGGPRAVTELLRGFGEISRRVPIVVLQHMPALFTAAFAKSIHEATGLRTCAASNGQTLQADRVYVAPGGQDLRLVAPHGVPAFSLSEGAGSRQCRPSLDLTFADAARLFGPGCLAVVLSGMGSDGTDGAKAIVAAGGAVLVQDERTSTVWGMPGSIARQGLAREVLPLGSIAGAVGAFLERRGR